MKGTKVIHDGEYIKRTLRLKYFVILFRFLKNNPDAPIRQMITELCIGRNVLVRVFRQAKKEELIKTYDVPSTTIKLYRLTDKGLRWVDENEDIEIRD